MSFEISKICIDFENLGCVAQKLNILIRQTCLYLNKGGLDLFKEVLWVSVGQRAAELRAVKVGGQQKILPISLARV